MKYNQIQMTDEDIIAARELHIEERTRKLNRMPKDWDYREDTIAEIENCKRDIIGAKQRIQWRKAR